MISVLEVPVQLSDRLGSVVVEEEEAGGFSDDVLMLNSPLVEEISVSHVGNWNQLVSQSNWEKGFVIIAWRESMIAAEMPKAAYSDDAWSRRVGNVSPQHVGRLRRVAERFGKQFTNYSGLYWSHFQTAVDWDDAEMWLEGAVQNSWSVAQMRVQRWEAIGAPEELKPREEDVFAAGFDDDVRHNENAFKTSNKEILEAKTREIGAADIINGFNPNEPNNTETENQKTKKKQKKSDSKQNNSTDINQPPFTTDTKPQPISDVLAILNNTATLPEDLAEAIEAIKVAILNHKITNWQNVKAATVLSCLDMLKALVISEEVNESDTQKQ
jgi:hypothetical protein